jgi:hypothetical protein
VQKQRETYKLKHTFIFKPNFVLKSMTFINEEIFKKLSELLRERKFFTEKVHLYEPAITLRARTPRKSPLYDKIEAIDSSHLGFNFSSSYHFLTLKTKLEKNMYLVGFELKNKPHKESFGGSFELRNGENPECSVDGGKLELKIPMGKPVEGLVLCIQDYARV